MCPQGAPTPAIRGPGPRFPQADRSQTAMRARKAGPDVLTVGIRRRTAPPGVPVRGGAGLQACLPICPDQPAECQLQESTDCQAEAPVWLRSLKNQVADPFSSPLLKAPSRRGCHPAVRCVFCSALRGSASPCARPARPCSCCRPTWWPPAKPFSSWAAGPLEWGPAVPAPQPRRLGPENLWRKT